MYSIKSIPLGWRIGGILAGLVVAFMTTVFTDDIVDGHHLSGLTRSLIAVGTVALVLGFEYFSAWLTIVLVRRSDRRIARELTELTGLDHDFRHIPDS